MSDDVNLRPWALWVVLLGIPLAVSWAYNAKFGASTKVEPAPALPPPPAFETLTPVGDDWFGVLPDSSGAYFVGKNGSWLIKGDKAYRITDAPATRPAKPSP